MVFFATQFFIGFITIGLRGLQTHNVIHGEYRNAAITSVLMSISGVAMIGLTSSNWQSSFLPVCLGSMLGVLCSMYYKHRNKGTKNDSNL